MMLILQGEADGLRLKQIEVEDCENLRVWKNMHKMSFFYQKDITPEQQSVWFAKHQANKLGFMFMAQELVNGVWESVGCMGFRLLNEEGGREVDVYNILRGRRVDGGVHSMAEAFGLMNAYVVQTYILTVRCKVLTANVARRWYEQNGFALLMEKSDYVIYELDKNFVRSLQVKETFA